MRTGQWKSIVVLALIVAGGVGWWRERQLGVQLRREIELQTNENAELARLRREHERLVAQQISRDELEKLRADRRAVDRLRTEIEALKVHHSETPAPIPVATPAESIAEADPPKAESLMTPANAWKNVGRATPQAALESALWAAAGGDVTALATMLTMDAAAHAKAQAMLAQLPAAAQLEYSTPERLIALLTAKDMPAGGMRILQQKKNGTDDVALNVVLESEGKRKGANLALHRTDDGWRLVVPESAVDKYAAMLAGTVK